MDKRNKMNKQVTIVGYVDPIDKDNEKAGIFISTDDEEYTVELNKVGRKLMNLIGDRVQVSGTLANNKGGDKVISVNSYEVLDDEDDYEDYEDDEEVDWYDDSDYP